jgi:hypothetical protein
MTPEEREFWERTSRDKRCPDTLIGDHGPLDRYGKCPWCGSQVGAPTRMPEIHDISELTWYYTQHYDPDWGGHNGA